MPSYMDLLNFGGGSFNDLSRLLQNQAGYIGGMGPDLSNMQSIFGQLQGFDPQNQFINMLQQFNPSVSGGVRERLMREAFDPESTAGMTLDEMLRTGAPVDVRGLGEAAMNRASQAFTQGSRGIKERQAAGGQMAGSGTANYLSELLGQETGRARRDIMGAEVGAAESAAGRRLGALSPYLAGRQLEQAGALGLGGLEQGASGQRLQAMLGGGNLQQGVNAQTLQALMGAGNIGGQMASLGLQGQQGQAGAGQSLINSLLPFAMRAGMGGQGGGGTPAAPSGFFGQRGYGGGGGGFDKGAIQANKLMNMMNLMEGHKKAQTHFGGGLIPSTYRYSPGQYLGAFPGFMGMHQYGMTGDPSAQLQQQQTNARIWS